MKRIIGIIAGALVLGWNVQSLLAYRLQYTSNGKIIRWHRPDLRYKINAKVLTIPRKTIKKIIQNSFKVWENALKGKLTFQFQGFTDSRSVGKRNNSEENLLIWQKKNWPLDPNASAFTLVTFRSDTGEILDADIIFNGENFEWINYTECSTDKDSVQFAQRGCSTTSRNQRWQPKKLKGKIPVDIMTIAVHEIGHFLGLTHSDNPQSVMYRTQIAGDLSKRKLSQDDIEGINALYPKSPTKTELEREGQEKNAYQLEIPPPPDVGWACSTQSPTNYSVSALIIFLIAIAIPLLFSRKN